MAWLHRLLKRGRLEHELDKELAYHVECRIAELVATGVTAKEAARRARLEFGGSDEIREACRDARGTRWLEDFIQDCRYAFRTMAGNKAFTTLAILSLALGIGANTAIYSFMDSILLRSLPVNDPESLVMLNWQSKPRGNGETHQASVMHGVHTRTGSDYDDPKKGHISGIFPYEAFELFKQDDSVFSTVFAHYQPTPFNLIIEGQADVANGEFVSGDFFRALSVPPAAGRLIVSDDDRTGVRPVAVLSYDLSQKRFGGPAQAVGQSISINSVPVTIAGVAPPEFFGVNPGVAPDFYLPMHANLLLGATVRGWYLDHRIYWIEMMARLRPGVTIDQAQAAWTGRFHQWVESTAANDAERANLPALLIREGGAGLDALRRQYSKPLYVLMTMVGLILAIACANIANLLLARSAARRREIALRMSVGAGRSRVIRQLLTESVLLASLGGILGVVLAIWGIRFLTLLLANGRNIHADLNWHVLVVAAALSLLTGIFFGLAPAMQSTAVDVISALKETRAGRTHTRARVSLGHVLVVGQIALSLLMLVAAGLFVRTLSNLASIDVGFNRENILLFQLNANQAGHRDPEIVTFYGDLRERFAAIPGVRNVSLSDSSLVTAGWGVSIGLPGAPPDPANRIMSVGPSFFSTMQIPILAGRDIDERDQPGSPSVAVINEVFAKKNFPDRSPLGQHLVMEVAPTPIDLEIVGVSKNAVYGGLKREIRPVVYFAYSQTFPEAIRQMVYALRTAGDPIAVVNTVREIVHQADSRVPVSDIRTQTAEIDGEIKQEIAFAKLCSAFALLALAIACVGLYGTISYSAARRTGEIGIRMALGAQRAGVVRMILRQVLVLTAIGLLIGLPTALGVSRFVQSFLYGMKPNDPLAMIAAVASLLSAAILAGYFPARKASRVDPMVALRHE